MGQIDLERCDTQFIPGIINLFEQRASFTPSRLFITTIEKGLRRERPDASK